MSYSVDIPPEVLLTVQRTADAGRQIQSAFAMYRAVEGRVNSLLSAISSSDFAAIGTTVERYDLIADAVAGACKALQSSSSAGISGPQDLPGDAATLRHEFVRLYPALAQPHVAETAEREIAELNAESGISWDAGDGIVIPEASRPQLLRVIADIANCIEEIVTPVDRLLIGIAVLLWIQFHDWEATVILLYSLYAPMILPEMAKVQASGDSRDHRS